MPFTARAFVVSLTAIITGLSPAMMRHHAQSGSLPWFFVTSVWSHDRLSGYLALVLMQTGSTLQCEQHRMHGTRFITMMDVAAALGHDTMLRDGSPENRAIRARPVVASGKAVKF